MDDKTTEPEISQEAARAMLAALKAARNAMFAHVGSRNQPTIKGCNIALEHMRAGLAAAGCE